MSQFLNLDPDSSGAAEAMPRIRAGEPQTVVIFGGTGDLTRRKLLPALYALAEDGLLPDEYRIVGCGRRPYTDDSYRKEMEEEIRTYRRLEGDDAALEAFMARVEYAKGELDDPNAFQELADRLGDEAYPDNRVFYLSTAPSFFGTVIRNLKEAGLIHRPGDAHWSRVVIEKPFGRDLESALALNMEVLRLLNESQVYRIDHYLGKETVQNILSFRFANTIFEPIFSNRFVDHIEITASETVGMESGRGAYYDRAGALRDMLQNHLLQLVCLATMEPPSGLASDAMRNEKVKVLQSIRTPTPDRVNTDVVRAQYAAGRSGDQDLPAYVSEDRVPGDSRTETFIAAKFFIDNWRWSGVPIYVRTGKRMAKKQTSITVQFKQPPMQFFSTVQCEGDVCDLTSAHSNRLTFRIQPDEGISLNFATKRPGMQLVVEDSKLEFGYADNYQGTLPEAYERLLLDVMRGDASLFTRSDEVEAAWRIVDPILKAWTESDEKIPVHYYAPGSWGPLAAYELFENSSNSWLDK